MTGRIRVNWLIAVGATLCGAVLLWAWDNGGERPVRPMTAVTTLPTVVQ